MRREERLDECDAFQALLLAQLSLSTSLLYLLFALAADTPEFELSISVGANSEDDDRDVEEDVEDNEGDEHPPHVLLSLLHKDEFREAEEGIRSDQDHDLVDDLGPVDQGLFVRAHPYQVLDHEHSGEDLREDLSVFESRHDNNHDDHAVATKEEDGGVPQRGRL